VNERRRIATELEFAISRYGTMEVETDKIAASTPQAGVTTELPHDRVTVRRLREAFPARWSDSFNAWFVPGRTVTRRIGGWLEEMAADRKFGFRKILPVEIQRIEGEQDGFRRCSFAAASAERSLQGTKVGWAPCVEHSRQWPENGVSCHGRHEL